MEDLNLNGLVDIGDLNILLKNWDNNLENILNDMKSNWGNKQQKIYLYLHLEIIIIWFIYLSVKNN